VSTAEMKFARKPERETDAYAKVWDVAIIRGEETLQPIGRLAQPKKTPREWTLIRPDDENAIVGETKLDAIRHVKQMYADQLPAEPAPERENDESLNGPDRVQRIDADRRARSRDRSGRQRPGIRPQGKPPPGRDHAPAQAAAD
jgi:hypothetical protein